ncbi:VOC family protein [bacterium]|nr:VOC family protein [bacterium]MCB1219122.1 VOC family protein [bacterium]UNM09660.1 MAG: VOC family protein [Planctomycetales bacterium]
MPDSICHINIPSRSLAESQDFYGSLFGWSFVPNTESYLLFNDGEQGLGGGFTTGREPSPRSGPVIFVKVEDLEARLAMVTQLGGKVLTERLHIGAEDTGFGWWASFEDPHGNHIGLFSTNQRKGN